MPKLRVFDVNFDEGILDSNYHDVINQFNTSFWTEKQWFFTHQHTWLENVNFGIFYSTDPYRRKDYQFYWQMDKEICPYIQSTNFNSVKHVQICSKRVTNNFVHYFPNATELTIKEDLKTFDLSISLTLTRIVPLKQLTKLMIDCYYFPFEELIHLLYFTPNLHTLKFQFLSLNDRRLKLIEKNDIFQYVSKKNQIKNLDLDGTCTFETMQLFMNLFPQVEYLKTQMKRKQIGQIIRFLLSKANHQLFFLCISETAKICLRELNTLIKTENLLDDYFMKFVDRDLYLWW